MPKKTKKGINFENLSERLVVCLIITLLLGACKLAYDLERKITDIEDKLEYLNRYLEVIINFQIYSLNKNRYFMAVDDYFGIYNYNLVFEKIRWL